MPGSKIERISLALVATIGGRFTDTPVERLPDPGALRDWLARYGLDVAGCSDADLSAARELREAVYDLVEAAATGRPPRSAALATVDTAANQCDIPRKLVWDERTGFHLSHGRFSTDQALTSIARDAVDLVTGPERDRLHQCEAETCGTVFIAPAGGRPRRWCSSTTCGNRERVRAFRTRR
ncbi:CGNR zinc finger domain-containing protein [Nocardia aurantiaca]|nr:CGNR zinc finger domain-containing protein [Nocardia aurantiaca]